MANTPLKSLTFPGLTDTYTIPYDAYVKPSGGIPASDLASAVQTSLGKADTALQTVDSALSSTSENPVQNKAVYNAINGNPTLIPESVLIWQFSADRTADGTTEVSGTRVGLKPECWIPVQVGKQYVFRFVSSVYKVAVVNLDSASTYTDYSWQTSGTDFTFTPTYGYVQLIIATTDGAGSITFANLMANYPEMSLKLNNGVADDSRVEVEEKIGIENIDRDSVVSGFASVSNGELVISENIYRASYNAILDVSNVAWISLTGNIFEQYDLAVVVYNAGYTASWDSGWITTAQSKMYLCENAAHMIIRIKEKANGVINYAVLLYNNELNLGYGTATESHKRTMTLNPFESLHKVVHIAHRGYQTAATENSIPAFIAAKAAGFDACETDVQATSDGVLVLMHDATVDRTTDGTGTVTEMTYAEIEELVINHGSEYTDEEMHVPTLAEYLEICRNYQLIPVIELKDGGMPNSALDTFIDTIIQYGMEKTVCVISTSIAYLVYLRQHNDNIYVMPLKYLTETDAATALAFGNSGLAVETFTLDAAHKALVQTVHGMGMFIQTYVVANQSSADSYIDYGVDGITSNDYFGVSSGTAESGAVETVLDTTFTEAAMISPTLSKPYKYLYVLVDTPAMESADSATCYVLLSDQNNVAWVSNSQYIGGFQVQNTSARRFSFSFMMQGRSVVWGYNKGSQGGPANSDVRVQDIGVTGSGNPATSTGIQHLTIGHGSHPFPIGTHVYIEGIPAT